MVGGRIGKPPVILHVGPHNCLALLRPNEYLGAACGWSHLAGTCFRGLHRAHTGLRMLRLAHCLGTNEARFTAIFHIGEIKEHREHTWAGKHLHRIRATGRPSLAVPRVLVRMEDVVLPGLVTYKLHRLEIARWRSEERADTTRQFVHKGLLNAPGTVAVSHAHIPDPLRVLVLVSQAFGEANVDDSRNLGIIEEAGELCHPRCLADHARSALLQLRIDGH
mmetsp:Transcript_89/g.287  ORF Transcript_89/g.287 Transcript_89/m.287 type:complete len:221 (+) Transcript_89:223-885(+)